MGIPQALASIEFKRVFGGVRGDQATQMEYQSTVIMHKFVACDTDYYIRINLYCYLLIFVLLTKSECSQNKNGSIICSLC